MGMGTNGTGFVAALDVGTTTLRCQIINSAAETVSTACVQVNVIYPQPGFVEINPDDFWHDIVHVVKQAIHNANLHPSNITCLGVTTQRSTFITWAKDTGTPFHNFIVWKDMRSKALVKKWNQSLTFKSFRMASYIIYLLTGSKRYLMGSGLNLTTIQCTGRLLWVLNNVPQVKENLKKHNVCFATIESWIVYKLTGGKTFVTDVTNASSTGLFDPFIMDWSGWPEQLMGIPSKIYPDVVDNDYDFGTSIEGIFGARIPIKCVMADQQSSMFGNCCFDKGDLKVTLGTGSFVDVNTGSAAHGSLRGIYPLVAWKFKNSLAYVAETACNDTGSLIQWALGVGLVENPEETSALAFTVEDTNGVHFIPAFSGLGPPISDDRAAAGFLGVKPTTKKSHMVRAIMMSIVFRIILALGVVRKELNGQYSHISNSVNGGVSKNDFVCQLLADMSGMQVMRTTTSEMSALGVAFAAGLNQGIWSDQDQLRNLIKIDRIFTPTQEEGEKRRLKSNLKEWLEVVKRFKCWY